MTENEKSVKFTVHFTLSGFTVFFSNVFLSNTPGKCSPDRRYHKWSYTRQIAAAIVRQLKYAGYDADDLAFLESAPGRQAIIELHVRGIIDYVQFTSR